MLLIAFLFFRNSHSLDNKISANYKFAVIGDYGIDKEPELKVATLVKNWNPDFIITVGDNNYNLGEKESIDKNIGKYYHEYIGNYMGSYGTGAKVNIFFPSLGNHDWYTKGAKPYLDYFTLPGNERYYDFVKGSVHFFALDSDEHEPDGTDINSKQGKWFKSKIANSNSKFKIVYFHHPPHSSGVDDAERKLMWDFKRYDIDVALCGHDHLYERLNIKGVPYIIVGTGGDKLDEFREPVSGSIIRYNNNHGALLVSVSNSSLKFEFYSIENHNKSIDSFIIKK
ncbi:MAG: metallophosphoesterase [Candidatus Melainabacteria bacterium]|nr:metallophosphoesterase [Candidatus Melainabacteria bacterium]